MLSAVQTTALKTAALRSLSTKVNDPYAAHLAGSKILAETAGEQTVKSGTRFIEDRTLWFDKKIGQTRHKNIVILGAGLDTRAYRLGCIKDKHIYETDFAEVLAYKTDKLFELDPPPTLACKGYAQFDFDIEKDDLWFNDALYVAEGLLYYISPEGVNRLFGAIPKGSGIVFDTIGDNVQVASSALHEQVKTDFLWGVDQPREYLDERGYAHQETLEYLGAYEAVPNMRLFMVHAEK